MNVRTWLIRLYPPAWRSRYGDEFEALLEQCLHSPLDVLDVAFGALDAHLGFIYENNWRIMNMVNKLRTTILIVFAAYIAFVVGGMSLTGLVDDSPALGLMQTDRLLSSAWVTIQAGAVIALLAVIAGGMPLALQVLRRAFVPAQHTWRYLLVPVLSFLALVVYGLFMVSIGEGWLHIAGVAQVVSPDNFPTGNKILLGGFMAVFILGAIVSTAAVWRAISGLETGETGSTSAVQPNPARTYKYTFALAGLTGLAMLVMLIATLVFGWTAHSALPQWFASNLGLLMINTGLSYGITVTIMVVSTAAAIFALLRGSSAIKTA